jgi:hypothetical protein
MYCTQVVIVSLLGLISLSLLTILLLLDISAQRAKNEVSWGVDFMKRSKTWILLLGMIMYFFQFLRNFL